MIVNGIGAVGTGITLIVVLVAKFVAGAWIVAILIPALILLMLAVKRHYTAVDRETIIDRPIRVDNLIQPFVIVPLDRWSRITEKGLRFAMKLSDQVEAVPVDAEECRDEVDAMWWRNVAAPIAQTGRAIPKLVFLSSPYRFVLIPLIDHILQVERDHPDRQIAVLVSELVVKHWWQTPLYDQSAQLLKLLLLVRGNQRIIRAPSFPCDC